jgi:hypothetical protein
MIFFIGTLLTNYYRKKGENYKMEKKRAINF